VDSHQREFLIRIDVTLFDSHSRDVRQVDEPQVGRKSKNSRITMRHQPVGGHCIRGKRHSTL